MARFLSLIRFAGSIALVGSLLGGSPISAQEAVGEKNEPPKFAQTLLAAVRQPKAGEFSKPVDVVRCYLETVREQNVEEATKCFPVREKFERDTLKSRIEEYRFYKPGSPDYTLPGAEAFQLYRILGDVFGEFYGLTNILLHAGTKETESVILSQDAEEARKQAAEIVKNIELAQQKLKEFEVRHLIAKEFDVKGDRVPAHRIGATALALVNVEIVHNSESIWLEFFVAKFETNWLITSQSLGRRPDDR